MRSRTRPSTRRSEAGFTLVEVMVAAAIAFMLMIVLWRLFVGTVKQFELSHGHLEAMQVGELVAEFAVRRRY